ncbi:MAG TPA: bifunctional 2-polyprenyl-6-hydroxyphenol methylase/3-demethylubiquinol 3-O-methyltransferase UbiG [Gammaproteobacteria bacterium]|nr:bifunctional 2-polyprenyl-6-hydroxyphenol methylase/3-demethylubiquinol 3-O-methyltransferase UbiG [Gammaproteobacteria bacterium]
MSPATNADPQELQTFDQVSYDWWNPEGLFKTLHHINPVRLQFITDTTNLNHKTVLDVGCGGGILTESLAAQGAQVTGIDMSEKALIAAREHALKKNIEINYQQSTVEDFANSHAQAFDVITCMELLEHVPDPASVVKACAQLLKPGGEIFFSTINRTFKAYAFAILGAEYLLKLLPKGLHTYDKFIRPSELAVWLRQSDLALLRVAGLSYNPITHACRLKQDTDVNYLVHCKAGIVE